MVLNMSVDLGIKGMSGGAKRQCNGALTPPGVLNTWRRMITSPRPILYSVLSIAWRLYGVALLALSKVLYKSSAAEPKGKIHRVDPEFAS